MTVVAKTARTTILKRPSAVNNRVIGTRSENEDKKKKKKIANVHVPQDKASLLVALSMSPCPQRVYFSAGTYPCPKHVSSAAIELASGTKLQLRAGTVFSNTKIKGGILELDTRGDPILFDGCRLEGVELTAKSVAKKAPARTKQKFWERMRSESPVQLANGTLLLKCVVKPARGIDCKLFREGLEVSNGAVTLQDCKIIVDSGSNEHGNGGHGITVKSGELTMAKTTVKTTPNSKAKWAVLNEPGTVVALRDCSFAGGFDEALSADGRTVVQRCVISGVRSYGICSTAGRAGEHGELRVERCHIAGTKGSCTGIQFYEDARGKVVDSTIEGHCCGVHVGFIEDEDFEDLPPRSVKRRVILANNTVTGNTKCGVECSLPATLVNNTIQANRGHGVVVSEEALVVARDNRVTGNKGWGLFVDHGSKEVQDSLAFQAGMLGRKVRAPRLQNVGNVVSNNAKGAFCNPPPPAYHLPDWAHV